MLDTDGLVNVNERMCQRVYIYMFFLEINDIYI